jgi:transposase-like protein
MNIFKQDKLEAAIAALVEGASFRSIERKMGVHRDTIMDLMIRVGLRAAFFWPTDPYYHRPLVRSFSLNMK